jgi:hypothetical protein
VGDGACFFRCISLVLFGMECYHWYFRDLLRIALLALSREQVIALYRRSSNWLLRSLVVEVDQYRDLILLDRENPTDNELWMVHTEFIKLLRKYTNWVSEIHIYLVDIFFGINVRVWSVSPRPIPPDVKLVLQQKQFLPIPRDGLAKYQRTLLNRVNHIATGAIIEMEAVTIPFIELRSDTRAQYDSELYFEYRFYGFHQMNILIDMHHWNYEHYNIIHWNPNVNIVNDYRLQITDNVHHKALKAYSISDSVLVSYPFYYDERNLAPVVIESRLQPNSHSLSYFLDTHINFLVEKYHLITSQHPDIAVELKSKRSFVRNEILERKNKLI